MFRDHRGILKETAKDEDSQPRQMVLPRCRNFRCPHRGGTSLLGRPTEIVLRPPGIPCRVRIRIGTTDEGAYQQVLLEQQYAIDLPVSPSVIVDAGANVGTTSIYFAHRYPKARIIAIKAEASNFALLSRNVQPYARITPIHAALWSQDGEMSLSLPEADTGSFEKWAFFVHEGPGVPVRTISLRSVMNEMKITSIDVLKVDIEGAEKEVFESCDWIDAVGCVIIELHVVPSRDAAPRWLSYAGLLHVAKGRDDHLLRQA